MTSLNYISSSKPPYIHETLSQKNEKRKRLLVCISIYTSHPLFNMHMYFASMYICLYYHCVAGSPGNQKRTSESLEWDVCEPTCVNALKEDLSAGPVKEQCSSPPDQLSTPFTGFT